MFFFGFFWFFLDFIFNFLDFFRFLDFFKFFFGGGGFISKLLRLLLKLPRFVLDAKIAKNGPKQHIELFKPQPKAEALRIAGRIFWYYWKLTTLRKTLGKVKTDPKYDNSRE